MNSALYIISPDEEHFSTPLGAKNGVKNGLELLLDMEAFEYAYFPRSAKGFTLAVSNPFERPVLRHEGGWMVMVVVDGVANSYDDFGSGGGGDGGGDDNGEVGDDNGEVGGDNGDGGEDVGVDGGGVEGGGDCNGGGCDGDGGGFDDGGGGADANRLFTRLDSSKHSFVSVYLDD